MSRPSPSRDLIHLHPLRFYSPCSIQMTIVPLTCAEMGQPRGAGGSLWVNSGFGCCGRGRRSHVCPPPSSRPGHVIRPPLAHGFRDKNNCGWSGHVSRMNGRRRPTKLTTAIRPYLRFCFCCFPSRLFYRLQSFHSSFFT